MLFNIYYDLLFLTGKIFCKKMDIIWKEQIYGVIDSEIFVPDTKRK